MHFHVIKFSADIFCLEKLWISPLCPHRRSAELYSSSVSFKDMSRQKRIVSRGVYQHAQVPGICDTKCGGRKQCMSIPLDILKKAQEVMM